MRSIILLGLLLLLSRIIKGSNQSHNLLLIALDKDSYGKAVEFATTVSSNILSPLDISIYAAAEDTSEGTGLEYWRGIIAAKPIADTSVSRKIKVVEKVTAILEALKTDMSRLRKKREQDQSNKMICVSFRSGSIPIPSVDFFKIFTLLDGPHKKETDVLLLEKNLHLQSMSTWHDLMIMGFRLSSKTDRWLHTVQDTYLRHAQRDAFALLEPRFAIREACIRDSLLRIRYFKSNEISVVGGAFEHSDVALIKLICTEEDIYTRDNACAVPHDPLIWRNEVHKGLPKTWSHLWNFGNQESRLDLNPMVSMWNGVIRFRAEAGNEAQNADAAKGDASFPRKFCWQSPGAEEKHAKARVIYSATNITTYVHSPKEPLLHQSGDQGNRSVLIISSSKGSARAIDGIKYVAMSKMYYCKRHGYTFRQMTSNKYTSFFPMNMFETCQNDILRPEKDLDKKKIGNYNYGKSVMSKPLMIAEAMLDQFDSLRTGDLWTVWTDDDIWINPGWLYMPLYEAYLESVPKSKIYVSSNYRSAFTNIVAIRNNVEGRALVYDWISVVMSGEIGMISPSSSPCTLLYQPLYH